MSKHALGALDWLVDHRQVGEDGGPSLRIVERAGERELLRFDCFHRAPHYHVDPDGRDEFTTLDPHGDAVTQAVEALRGDLGGFLDKAGFAGDRAWSDEECAETLAAVEASLRNPQAGLDDLDLAELRARFNEKWETYPKDVLPAWVAEMDYPLAEPIRRVLQRALDRSDVGYPIAPKKTGLREAFADRMAERFDWAVDVERVEILSDVVQGMYLSLEAYSEEGDGAVVQTAIYPPFIQSVTEMKRSLVESRAEPRNGRFEFDLDALRAKTDERTRLLMLCNPHNPTGRVFSRAELVALAELARERDLVVVTDEIHADLLYDGRTHIPFATLSDDAAARTVTLTSATKAFNIPGLRCAVAHFGSAELQRRFTSAAPSHIRGGIGLLGLYATQAAWRHSQPWLDDVMAYLAENRALLRRFVAERMPGVVFYEPEATYLAWLDFGNLDLPISAAKLFYREARVVLSDGRHFGEGFEGFARLNFATSRAILTEILERIADTLDQHRQPASDAPR